MNVMTEKWEVLSSHHDGYIIVTALTQRYVCTVALEERGDSLNQAMNMAIAHNKMLSLEYNIRSLNEIIQGESDG